MGEHNFASLQARLQRSVDSADRGQVMPLTAAALVEFDPITRLEKLVAALESERLLAPALVESGEECITAATRIPSPYGEVTVAFTDYEALRRWAPQARPVPIAGRQQALMAMAETGGRLLINPVPDSEGGSSELSGIRLPRPAVQALAHGDSWLPPWRDDDLRTELQVKADALQAGLNLTVSVLADVDPTLKVLLEFSVPYGLVGLK